MYTPEERERLSAARRHVLDRRLTAGTWRMAPVVAKPPTTPPPPPPPKDRRYQSWDPETVALWRAAAQPLLDQGLTVDQATYRLRREPPPGGDRVPAYSTLKSWLSWGLTARDKRV